MRTDGMCFWSGALAMAGLWSGAALAWRAWAHDTQGMIVCTLAVGLCALVAEALWGGE